MCCGYGKGIGMNVVYYCDYKSPLGTLYIAATEKGVCKIAFPGRCEKDFIPWMNNHFSICERNINPVLHQAITQLDEYFQGQRKVFEVPLDLIGTDFQKKVWEELIHIPYGTVVTYRYIAERIGNPKASRAVGGANNKNPVPIIIPCHRVIGRNGSLVGYAAGLEIKERLLKLEGCFISPKYIPPFLQRPL